MGNYSNEIAIQVLLQLLKRKGIKKVIVSPGTTNASFVASLQSDAYFEMYSCIDERSAAYMACGLSAESGEVVVLSCTGATASRNYLPALTEAYHSKLPILAVTSTQTSVRADNLIPQYIDRSSFPKDAVRYSVHIPFVRGSLDTRDCILKINRALSELHRGGGGPVHINLTTNYTSEYVCDFSVDVTDMDHYYPWNDLPQIPEEINKIAISIGTHKKMSEKLTNSIEYFCEKYGAVVLTDHSSHYYGDYGCQTALLLSQKNYNCNSLLPDLLIHIGEESGDYDTYHWLHLGKIVWRVSEDGIMRDTFGHLDKVFEMNEAYFFDFYASNTKHRNSSYLKQWKSEMLRVKDIPEVPFSNVWVANRLAGLIPSDSVVHLGVSNTLRAWSFFEFDKSITVHTNTGTRGIDGAMSTLIGHSLADSNKICYGILGDLSFFYDLNVLGNRHVGKNVRLLLINNNGGAMFYLYNHYATTVIKNNIGEYIAAAGHNGNKSRKLIKNYAEELGFEYICADSKESFEKNFGVFISPRMTEKPILFELFIENSSESEALELMHNIYK
ncbi:MAG: thiamine pyrophosphate binding domain-containing protein [Lachnospiraceae bacterium]|nr:thiamine pyrophosphate binding domain-containing protein [Lachnospiraceae bacterium]